MSFLSQPITLQSLFGKDRSFGEITIDVIINESTSDVLTITKQPVQTGTPITDHSYKEPTTLSMKMRFNDNLTRSLSKIYQDLIDLQLSKEPFDVITPKRIYRDMLISGLGLTTDKYTENVLAIDINFQQILLVAIAQVTVPISKQRIPKKTAATQAAGKKSVLETLFGNVGRR